MPKRLLPQFYYILLVGYCKLTSSYGMSKRKQQFRRDYSMDRHYIQQNNAIYTRAILPHIERLQNENPYRAGTLVDRTCSLPPAQDNPWSFQASPPNGSNAVTRIGSLFMLLMAAPPVSENTIGAFRNPRQCAFSSRHRWARRSRAWRRLFPQGPCS